MRKIRLFALVLMLGSFFFIFNETNSANTAANYCLAPGDTCHGPLGGCCSKICCQLNDTRWQCEGIEINTCW